ncbi:MAG: hypothetical protein AAF629_10675 [Chloroflexota bacterium]
MFGSGRTIGIVFIIAGTLVACGGSAMSAVTNYPESTEKPLPIMAIPLAAGLSVVGFGFFSFRRGCRTLHELATIQKQKKLLGMLRHEGWVDINDLARELQTDTNDIQYLVNDLVEQGLFHGYFDWQASKLFSKHQVVLQGATHCPSCGGQQTFSGRGMIPCRHCDVQVLL